MISWVVTQTSNCNLLVCDIQGVEHFFTDPQVQCQICLWITTGSEFASCAASHTSSAPDARSTAQTGWALVSSFSFPRLMLMTLSLSRHGLLYVPGDRAPLQLTTQHPQVWATEERMASGAFSSRTAVIISAARSALRSPLAPSRFC